MHSVRDYRGNARERKHKWFGLLSCFGAIESSKQLYALLDDIWWWCFLCKCVILIQDGTKVYEVDDK